LGLSGVVWLVSISMMAVFCAKAETVKAAAAKRRRRMI